MHEKLGSEEVIWDLTHLYNGIDDKDVAADIEKISVRVRAFSERYRGKLNKITPEGLLELIKELEDISQSIARIGSFAYLNFSTQSGNAPAGAFLQRFRETASQFQKDLLFFDLEWAALEKETALALVDNPVMEKYRHYLIELRKYSPYLLTEVEEKLLAEIAPVGAGSWNNLFDKVLSQMKFGKTKRMEEEVLSDLYRPDRQVRITASEDFTQGLKGQLHVLTHIFNTILGDKMIKDRMRKYPDWISSMNLANEIDDRVVSALVEAVRSRYDIPQRYYRLKKALLGYDELFDYDRYAPLPFTSERVITWDEGKEMVLDAYGRFSPQMKNIAQMFFDERWIHAPVMSGKRGGAFSDPSVPDVHPYLLVNYTGNSRDVQTLAHELGHGVHQYLAGRQQGYFNSQTPLTMAETASVFGEMLVFRSQLDRAGTRNEKLVLLCRKLEDMFATVFRQVSMNRFEDAIHSERRNSGELSTERFCELWLDTQREMFGDSVNLTDNYRIWWSYIPHFLQAPGYVYAYAFGELLVLSLFEMFRTQGEDFIPKYLQLLSSGGKDSPENLLMDFGVSLEYPDFWHDGLKIIDKLLEQAESMV